MGQPTSKPIADNALSHIRTHSRQKKHHRNSKQIVKVGTRMNTHKADLKSAVSQWADHIGVEVREVHLRQMQRKWASISTNGRLTLNTDLLNLPEMLKEYVIVHELVHLLVPNHGKLFKGYMSAYLPDWEERQSRLQLL
ncbi:M48 family metallopeptidase [Candidatus Poribacteria bacterium]|nr:M48 family metallopeptidase [Candidatus Poribacteria bacterium]